MQITERARQLWRLLEPIHAVVYFAPEAREHFEAVGLKGFWMGYFASRAAPLGPVGPEVVGATFYVFHPAMVERAIPDAWDLATPESILEARSGLADMALRRALGDLANSNQVAVAAALATNIASEAPLAGRPLGAAHAAVAMPQGNNALRLWWAATVLREHRGDGHVAALVSAGVDPCEALILAAATGAAGPSGATILQASRKWPDDEWSAATQRLTKRGWLDQSGGLTDLGQREHQRIEETTDRSASVAFASHDDQHLDALRDVLRLLARQIASSGALPFPNPIGLDPNMG